MSRRSRGVSLAEAIIACFVMVSAMLVSSVLYHSALNHSVRIDRKHKAARVVERRIEEIRSWSQEMHGTNGTLEFSQGWEKFSDQETEDEEFPGLRVVTKIQRTDLDESHDLNLFRLYSPSSSFEKINFAAQSDKNVPQGLKEKKRLINDSAYFVEVAGRWGMGPEEQLIARTLIADPVKDYGWSAEEAWKAVVIMPDSSIPATLTRNGKIGFSALVKDRNGQVVKNAVVQWYIDPKSSGNGTIEVDPSESNRCTFENVVKVVKDPGPPLQELQAYTGGAVRIVARIRLGGIEAVNKTATVTLEGPP